MLVKKLYLMKIKQIIIWGFIILTFLSYFYFPVFAQEMDNSQTNSSFEETLVGKVVKVLEEKKIEVEGQEPTQYQKLEVLITEGSLKDKTINIEVGDIATVNQQKYQPDEEVVITYTKGFDNEDVFYITDYVRHKSLVWLFVIFVILTVVIGKWRGISSIFGMGLSFLVIFKYILPSISQGADPINTSIIGSLFIIPISFYLSHGFNKKTTVAVVGTLIALVITGLLAKTYIEVARLTGFASEEAAFLQVAKQGVMNMKGLLLAGIIIGVLGVLDDITISQSAVVFQLKKTNPSIKQGELYKAAMNVGQDHIASMVNTLVLVYTGAALPLFLLFINNPKPFHQTINFEPVAEEIVRTLVGSIGLILAVPITTFIASFIAQGGEKNESS
ncbi:hypothetical protein COV53_03640 [Candidatus Gottesmanbacteria bacterium CG11_big_fil_rev_8_21_14_0_20_37_11]|uniref:YibE/F family protein n=3 Tax=Candidatus Gottesmaniibacteriota TaxID=1752720 RepID=A0A2M7RRR1_9BACT|nr:MAG: hypothetical protein AUJ73_01290 [Candidatus Gottesmanbacteria bacterium CG1_02_37_22]PIP32883.1 MAG: hypothetical protein COX23_02395 [Candidatus Gottesmanbacteria bacterium CG23_combo_of_CG06-09_8_20_14_all_37_19]PIR08307.1 MAG: hypothetical protein COV53_03640 [Candidatus Gottesmanbacteria bacterium CG11_big_fil_rev_8_21_14_0_20_37_11]PIZ02998.1 MAG: YibE/F family protein [Candidatus Gottesmanbacteria bacterium CG_4_10_14_0_8_um_filter_37_24]